MKNVYFLLFCVGFYLDGFGQNTIRPNIYFQNMNYYNPSAITLDSSENYNVSLYGKHKFVENEDDIWKKPTTLLLNHSGRIRQSNSFYSLSYISDKYSFYNRNTVYAGYSHQIKLGSAGTLSLGGRVVLNFDAISWNKLELVHNKTGKSTRFSPDVDFGVQYQSKRFTTGLSSKNMMALSSNLDGSELLKNKREFYVNTSYELISRKNFRATPFLLLYTERKSFIDGGLTISAFNRIDASYTLRINELRGIYYLGVDITKGFQIGASLDRSALLPDNNLDVTIKYSF